MCYIVRKLFRFIWFLVDVVATTCTNCFFKVSSESSAASESSSVSVRSTSHSNPSSPLLEEYPSQSLNDAMVEDSLVDISRSSSLVLQELTGDQAADVRGSLLRPPSARTQCLF